jgi:hypothetical protein
VSVKTWSDISRPPRYVFLTFGDGSLGWRNAARRLAGQARRSGLFVDVVYHNRRSLLQAIPELAERNFQKNVRGFGYWVWKPYMVNHYLQNFKDDVDGIAYLDAGCTINATSESLLRFRKYMEWSQSSGGLCFQMNLPEQVWTKEDLLAELRASETARKTGQIVATVFLLNKSKGQILSSRWLELALKSHLLDDSPSRLENHRDYIEHRHDQSIFSLLAKELQIKTIPDETAFHPGVDGDKTYESLPVWATRHRSRMNSLSMNFVVRAIRLVERLLP